MNTRTMRHRPSGRIYEVEDFNPKARMVWASRTEPGGRVRWTRLKVKNLEEA